MLGRKSLIFSLHISSTTAKSTTADIVKDAAYLKKLRRIGVWPICNKKSLREICNRLEEFQCPKELKNVEEDDNYIGGAITTIRDAAFFVIVERIDLCNNLAS